MYHPTCHRLYTAVKRSRSGEESESLSKVPRRETRTVSALPKTDKSGILKELCIFCGKKRKKRNGKEEKLTSVAVPDSCETLVERSERSNNAHFKSLVMGKVDLIAKEGKYHKSCRTQFMHETELPGPSKGTSHEIHKRAFASICHYIDTEILKANKCVLVSSLLNKYKTEYCSTGGDPADISTYSSQNLLRKVHDSFSEKVRVQLVDQRRGNYICSVMLTDEEARTQIFSEEHEETEKLRWAANHLRSIIMQMPKTKTPDPATVQNLKESAPPIPKQLDFFFRSLLGGTSHGEQNSVTERKVASMASDAIFNVTRGTVKPWKHIAMGLGLSSLTGSRLTMQILNRSGHSISYSDTKGLESEFAYSVTSDGNDTPDGIRLLPNRATACVWDNNDANVETLDGKATLHSTVGHTYQNILEGDNVQSGKNSCQFREGRNRRTFIGCEQEITAFRKSLKAAKFNYVVNQNIPGNDDSLNLKMSPLEFCWLWQVRQGETPLYAGFISKFVNDPLPLQRICYMDPLPKSPTDNAVVKETMKRTLNVARETGQEYAVVTYVLAIALKAYSIQALEAPQFDKLLIMLGNFHIELAFYGAVGTLINETAIEFVLTEAEILAEGSMMGFIKGKFYNRCTRIHELLATALELKLYDCFMMELPEDEQLSLADFMNNFNADDFESTTSAPILSEHLQKYEEFFMSVIHGSKGPMAQFWGTYVFLINRVHRELQRCVKTNDVDGYIAIFPTVLDVFFALNRPNYARWGTLFLQKLTSSNPQCQEILKNGAFSIRRTKKTYCRSAVDISLEQTVNRDAASSLKGIVAFRNSENAMRRWSLTMTQRAMAVTELRTFAGLEVVETAAAQCRPSRIRKDSRHLKILSDKINEFCNPFGTEVQGKVINFPTGRAATTETENYIVHTLQRGSRAREQFVTEWANDTGRFLKPVKKMPVKNFAAENEKKKKKGKTPAVENAKKSAESLRDFFVRMIVIVAERTNLDLRHVLSHPITTYPLSLAHADGAPLKTPKNALLHKLEELQTIIITDEPEDYTQIFDGGLLIHSVVSVMNVGASYGSIARKILSAVASGKGEEIHICLDKYIENSIKDSERKLRGADDAIYTITGPDQTMRQQGEKLLTNGNFKNELATFLMKEWTKDHYWNVMNGKTLYVSYGGECLEYISNESQKITVVNQSYLQADHEEADTLIAFHLNNLPSRTVLVRASDTDVLVILVGMLGHQRQEVRSTSKVIMDCGNGNSRRYINVSNIVDVLEERKPGLAKALPGYHAFTGCDFTSSFYR